ncbi:MAG: FmdB family transcriptional regulator [Actinomycetia bacterium]|nr:FmdB family transcriptional regulator [Actinomycetes bacterium]
MPTYSYACTECANKFDVVQAFTEDSITECPQCDGRLRKVFGKVGVVFKGSGFYRNDSREAAKSSAESSGSGSSDTAAATSSDKSTSDKSSSDKGASETSSSSGKSASSDKSSSPSKSSSAPAATASN